MLEPVLARVEVLIVLLHGGHFGLDHFLNLLLRQLLAVQPRQVLRLLKDLFPRLLLHQLFLGNGQFRILLLKGRRSQIFLHHRLVVERLPKVDLNVGLNDADLVIWLALNDVDQVVFLVVMDVNCVSLHEAGVVGELLLEDGLGVRQVNEGCLMRLKHDKFAFL